MTFNFGHKLLLAFVAFGTVMFLLVYGSMRTNFELVSKQYYKDELAYQEVIDAARNAQTLETPPYFTQDKEVLLLQMPAEMQGRELTGEVFFYCASDASKDRKIPLKVDAAGKQQFALFSDLVPGSYSARVRWIAGNTEYYHAGNLQVK